MKTEIAILELLHRRSPDLAREVALRNELEIAMGKTLALADVKVRLRALETAGEVFCVANADSGNKWGLTDAGQARLMRALD